MRYAMRNHDCPQCEIQMEQTAVTAEGIGDLYVTTERDNGVLKRLGIGENTPLEAYLCPECGLTQLYADLSP